MRYDEDDNKGDTSDINPPTFSRSIEPLGEDIHHTHSSSPQTRLAEASAKRGGEEFSEGGRIKRPPNKFALVGVFLLACVFVIAGIVFFQTISSKLSAFTGYQAEQSAGTGETISLNLENAKGRLGEILNTLKTTFTGARESIAGVGNLASEISGLVGDVSFLQKNLISLVAQKKGEILISRLSAISHPFKKIQE